MLKFDRSSGEGTFKSTLTVQSSQQFIKVCQLNCVSYLRDPKTVIIITQYTSGWVFFHMMKFATSLLGSLAGGLFTSWHPFNAGKNK